jgi:hypothetical protein
MKWCPTFETRALTAILLIAILFGNIPIAVGFTIQATRPECTVNICQPLQPGESIPSSPLARPAATLPQLCLIERESTFPLAQNLLSDLYPVPESPPPEA